MRLLRNRHLSVLHEGRKLPCFNGNHDGFNILISPCPQIPSGTVYWEAEVTNHNQFGRHVGIIKRTKQEAAARAVEWIEAHT